MLCFKVFLYIILVLVVCARLRVVSLELATKGLACMSAFGIRMHGTKRNFDPVPQIKLRSVNLCFQMSSFLSGAIHNGQRHGRLGSEENS